MANSEFGIGPNQLHSASRNVSLRIVLSAQDGRMCANLGECAADANRTLPVAILLGAGGGGRRGGARGAQCDDRSGRRR